MRRDWQQDCGEHVVDVEEHIVLKLETFYILGCHLTSSTGRWRSWRQCPKMKNRLCSFGLLLQFLSLLEKNPKSARKVLRRAGWRRTIMRRRKTPRLWRRPARVAPLKFIENLQVLHRCPHNRQVPQCQVWRDWKDPAVLCYKIEAKNSGEKWREYECL